MDDPGRGTYSAESFTGCFQMSKEASVVGAETAKGRLPVVRSEN